MTPKGKTLGWTEDDRLWLLRAVEAEGEPRDLVAQTLVNRWAFLCDETPGRYMHLAELVRAYSQPVNPAWFPDGKLFAQELETLPEAQRSKAALQARTRRDVHSAKHQFAHNTTIAVDQALRGPVTIPPGALHFGPATSLRSDLPVLVPAPSDRHNVIYGASNSRGARARYSVSTAEVAALSTSSRVASTVGVLALGFGLGLHAAAHPTPPA